MQVTYSKTVQAHTQHLSKGGYIFVERGGGAKGLSTIQTVGANSYITLTCMLVVLKVS